MIISSFYTTVLSKATGLSDVESLGGLRQLLYRRSAAHSTALSDVIVVKDITVFYNITPCSSVNSTDGSDKTHV